LKTRNCQVRRIVLIFSALEIVDRGRIMQGRSEHPLENTPLAVVRTADDLRSMFRNRIVNLGISYETADQIGGLPLGYTAKLLAPNPVRRIGPVAFECLLGATGIKLLAVEDAEAMARVKGRHVRRRRRLSLKRAVAGAFTKTLDSEFMRKIGTLGGFKTAQSRHAIASRKKARSEIYRGNALKRWRPQEIIGP
jgi:hypothetical protein